MVFSCVHSTERFVFAVRIGSRVASMWAAIRWVKSRKKSAPYPGKEEVVVPDEIPPRVAADREAFGSSGAPALTELSHRDDRASSSWEAPGTPVPSIPRVRHAEILTEAGEESFQVRSNGPWVANPEQNRLARGSARLAEDIAGSGERVENAVRNFQSLVYAPSTSAKEALFSLWCKITRRQGLEPLPLTPALILVNAAILREAGYKAIMSYVFEAKERHVRSGYLWTAPLQSAVQDAKRASKRAQGEAKRAEEVRYEWWAWLVEEYGPNPLANDAADDAPKDMMELVAVAQQFLLREVEACSLFLDSWCLKLDGPAQTAGLFLPVSKTDPQGAGVLRTLSCICKVREDPMCPYHALARVVCLQLARFGFASLEDVPIAWLPLFGQKENTGLPVSKTSVVKEMQRLAGVIQERHPDKLRLCPLEVTGHSFRRSGIKALGRLGVQYTAVQWLARHSSNVTMIYLEEAYEESPGYQRTIDDAKSVSERMTELVQKHLSMEQALTRMEEELKRAMDREMPEVQMILPCQAALRHEMRRAMVPKAVVNLERRCLHLVNQGTCFDENPSNWTTRCGWSWIRAHSCSRPMFDDDNLEAVDASRCGKCFA